jgi:SAM-dependent methyltransferase
VIKQTVASNTRDIAGCGGDGKGVDEPGAWPAIYAVGHTLTVRRPMVAIRSEAAIQQAHRPAPYSETHPMTTQLFSAHNIQLDDGTFTKTDGITITASPWFLSAKSLLTTVFPGDRSLVRIADLGCLEGGFSVEFARLGFAVLGLDVRSTNIAACQYVKAKTDLPLLEFVQDDVWNLAKHGPFDAVFCCGLLYHLDRPRKFIELLSAATKKLMILQTHFSVADAPDQLQTPQNAGYGKFNLSQTTEHEGLQGRWYQEFATDDEFRNRESFRWSSWENKRSFWIQREYLLGTIKQAGFDAVFEQFDGVGEDIAAAMLHGYYKTDTRGTFIGLKV